MNTVMLLASIVILFVGFIFALLIAEKMDSKEKDSKKEKTFHRYERIFYPTKCEKCKKLDKFVTRPGMRFCNSCHADYIMID